MVIARSAGELVVAVVAIQLRRLHEGRLDGDRVVALVAEGRQTVARGQGEVAETLALQTHAYRGGSGRGIEGNRVVLRCARYDQHLSARTGRIVDSCRGARGENENLDGVVFHLAVNGGSTRTQAARRTEAEAGVARAGHRIAGHGKRHHVVAGRHWQAGRDLFAGFERPVTVEVDPGIEHTGCRRGHPCDRGQPGDENRGQRHPVFVIAVGIVVVPQGILAILARLTIRVAVDLSPQEQS